MKKELVDTLYCMKLSKKNNTNLVYYLAKVSIDDKLQEMGYERLPQNKCKGSGSRRSLPISDVIFGWNGEKYLVEPVHKHKLENKSIYFTKDEFDSCLNHEAFEGENMVYNMEVKSYDVYNYLPESLKELYKDMDKDEDIVWDIETTGLDRFTDEITSIQFSWISTESKKERDCFLVYNEHSKDEWTKLFKNLADKKLVAHNGKFDSLFIYEKLGGIQLPLTDDTLCMSHCTDNEEYGLKPNVLKWFHHDYDIDTKDKTGSVTRKLKLYGILDVIYTRKLKKKLEPRLDKWGTRKIYNHEIRAYRAYYKVEQVGVPLSNRAGEISKQLEEEASVYKERLLKVANINWASNPQVATVMFSPEGEPIYAEPKKHKWVTSVLNDTVYKTKKEATEDLKAQGYKPKEMGLEAHEETTQELIGYGLGLKPKGKTSSGKYKVGKDILAEYSNHPVIKDLIEWKKLDKLKQFPDKWMEQSHNGRVYPSFNLTARTGRTTCSGVNIQQCPQSSAVRNLIGGKAGMKLEEVDYSQCELRVASMFAGDKNMQDAYNAGSDLHSKTTELLFGDTSNLGHDEQKRLRTQAKSCFSGDTEILTEDGFIKFNMYDGSRKVAQYNLDTHEITFVKPYDFRMIPNSPTCIYEDENTALKLTPNHECVYLDQKGRYKKTAFENLAGHGQTKYQWVNAGYYKNTPCESEEFTRFLASFVSDGSYTTSRTTIKFGFTKERKIKRFKDLLNNLGVEFKEQLEGKNKVTTFYINDFNLVNKVKLYCSVDKTLNRLVLKNLDYKVYLDEAVHWDGHRGKYNLTIFSSTNESTIDTMQIMCVLSGIKARKYYDGYIYTLSYNMKKKATSSFISQSVDTRTHHHATCNVYCVTVPEHNIVIRYNGKVSIQGNCNFGFLYGMSAKTFVGYARSYGLNLTQEESEKLRDDFFKAYPRLPEWHDECKAYLHKHGYSYSPSGRKRFFPQVYSNNPRIVASAERGCVNAGVQGFASDLCVSALADIVFSEELDHSKFNVVGSVHDAILLEVQEDYAQELGKKVQAIMSHPSILDDLGIEIPVPLKADLSIGDAWGMEE